MDDRGDVLAQVQEGKRFPFGANWVAFLDTIDERQIKDSKDALQKMLDGADLQGKTFLDAGCGSGIHSLAAKMLGAKVVSFDLDPLSVECVVKLRSQIAQEHDRWRVMQGSVLDRDFLTTLGTFDVVYSWGVLHHTGSMWEALSNVASSVAKNGVLFVAIYNDQGWLSRYWKAVKVLYNRGFVFRWLLVAAHLPYLVLGRIIINAVKGRRSPGRGMSYLTDMKDWLGGLPFEVARPDEIVRFLKRRGFILEKLKTCGHRPGCNEFVLRKS